MGKIYLLLHFKGTCRTLSLNDLERVYSTPLIFEATCVSAQVAYFLASTIAINEANGISDLSELH